MVRIQERARESVEEQSYEGFNAATKAQFDFSFYGEKDPKYAKDKAYQAAWEELKPY